MSASSTGDRDPVTALHDGWADRGRRTRLLGVGLAAHSAHLDPLLDEYRATLRTLDLRPPHTPLPLRLHRAAGRGRGHRTGHPGTGVA
ncbi:hypothetical protein [Streptomyces sp. 11x1]|uniref:hypothetical protein n=1 Tax=Streptomyces sp. 11x1 TaxID=3038642 RepID=UPI00292E91C5|nr:hypothetical protein [Streptomyces sp. 11x1]WNZ06897.1 hypothetical protein P8T65_04305 [Streptomyces sp. 11x1]